MWDEAFKRGTTVNSVAFSIVNIISGTMIKDISWENKRAILVISLMCCLIIQMLIMAHVIKKLKQKSKADLHKISIELLKTKEKYENEFCKINDSRKALASMYDRQRQKINKYDEYWEDLNRIASACVASPTKEKLNNLHDQIVTYSIRIKKDKGENND